MAIRFETPIIHTARLRLRPAEGGRCPRPGRIRSGMIVKNMTKGVPWFHQDGAKHWFEQAVLKAYANKSESIWAITERENLARLIGVVSIREDTMTDTVVWSESEWGKGYMTEAVTALNDWVFAETPLAEIGSNVASNEASRA